MAAPLYYASLAGHENVVQGPLQKGADVNMQGGGYGNALHTKWCWRGRASMKRQK